MDERAAIERTAIEACLAGGRYLSSAFDAADTDVEHVEGDVKSSADVEAERRMLSVIRDAFPEHRIYAEETGVHDGEGWKWVLDPMDGTNNFEAGLPLFASAAAVRRDETTEVGVVYAPVTEDLYVGVRGEGVRKNGRPVDGGSDLAPERATVGTVIGHEVKRVPEHAAVADRIARGVEDRCKRRLETWSPTVDWGLLAEGRIEGVVVYRPDPEERYLGELFGAESDGPTASGDEWFVAAGSDRLLDDLVAVVESARE